jgi:hypothetical protein
MDRVKYKTGVTYYPNRLRRKWKSVIKLNGKTVALGYHPTEEEAHQAYLKAKADKLNK